MQSKLTINDIFEMLPWTNSEGSVAITPWHGKWHIVTIAIMKWNKRSWPFFMKVTIIILTLTRGIQKVRRLTQLATRYARRTSYFVTFQHSPCNWNAIGLALIESSDSDIEELLFFVFQPAICHAIRIRMANMVGERVVQSWHFGWQPVLEPTCDQVRCPGSK